MTTQDTSQRVILRRLGGVVDVLRAPDRAMLTATELDRLERLPDPALVRRWDTQRSAEILVIGHRWSTTGRVAYRVVDQIRAHGTVIAERIA